MKIIFVCTGNTCRSPMAEAISKKMFSEYNLDIISVSRGTDVYIPMTASQNAMAVAKMRGLDLSRHISRPISAADISNADIVLTMTRGQKRSLKSTCTDNNTRIYMLKEFTKGLNEDILDPYGRDLEVYLKCFDEIKTCIARIPLVIKNFKKVNTTPNDVT